MQPAPKNRYRDYDALTRAITNAAGGRIAPRPSRLGLRIACGVGLGFAVGVLLGWWFDKPVIITAYGDRTFSFVTKTPPASYFLRKAAKLPKGSKAPGREKAGTVTRAQVREIAEAKMPDLNANDVEAAMKIIEGSARSMGLEVVG